MLEIQIQGVWLQGEFQLKCGDTLMLQILLQLCLLLQVVMQLSERKKNKCTNTSPVQEGFISHERSRKGENMPCINSGGHYKHQITECSSLRHLSVKFLLKCEST